MRRQHEEAQARAFEEAQAVRMQQQPSPARNDNGMQDPTEGTVLKEQPGYGEGIIAEEGDE
jgi:hypothetical protein